MRTGKYLFDILQGNGSPQWFFDARLFNTVPCPEVFQKAVRLPERKEQKRKMEAFLRTPELLIDTAVDWIGYVFEELNHASQESIVEFIANFESVTMFERPEELLTAENILRPHPQAAMVGVLLGKELPQQGLL